MTPNFCPYCGARTIDAGPHRTYCTTCGEDVVTPGQLEDLRDELAEAVDDLKDVEKTLKQTEEDLEKAAKRVLDLYTEIDTLTDALNAARAELEALQEVQPL